MQDYTLQNTKTQEDIVTELFQQYNHTLYKYLLKKIGNVHTTEDILFEVWYTAILKYDKLQNHANKKAWLFKVSGLCLKRYYQNISRKSLSLETLCGDFSVLNLSYNEEFYEGLPFEEYEHLLTPKELRYIRYRYCCRLDNSQISQLENSNYTAITSLGNRVRNKIKKSLGDNDY